MSKPILFGVALSFFAFNTYAADPACAKMKSWDKIEGFSYKSTTKQLPSDEDDHSETEGKIVFCNKSGDVVWSTTHTSESIWFSVEATELTGDKKKEIIVEASMGAAYPYNEQHILVVTGPGSLFEAGSLPGSMPDGYAGWRDIDGDGAQEAIYPRDDGMGVWFIPEIYAFDASGALVRRELSEYPKFLKEYIEDLYSNEACNEANKYLCTTAETFLLLQKSGASLSLEPIAALETSFNHASFAGWTEDSAEYGYCAPRDEKPSASRCEFVDATRSRTLTDYVSGVVQAEKTKEIEVEASKKRADDIFEFQTFKDLKPVWKIESSKKGPVVKIGAQRPGNQPAHLHSITADLKKDGLNAKLAMAHIDHISLSPNGERLGVLVHFMDGATSVYKVRNFPVNKIAGNAYNVAGLEYHKKENFIFSAALFGKALAADKEAKWPAFNLACAYSRLGEEEKTQEALDVVISQKNKDIIKKIATDPDLEAMRSMPWFSKYGTP